MGLLWGWEELADGRVLEGDVFHEGMELASDGDWCFKVAPMPTYAQLLVNPRVDKPNTNGLIDCEIEPPEDLKGQNAQDSKVMMSFIGHMKGRRVTVVGTWVIDKAYRYDGAQSPCIFSECLDGKTEIHPITSIFHDRPQPDEWTREFDFLVFSDDSMNFPRRVPHSGESRIGTFRIGVPEGATWQKLHEIDMARSTNFDLEPVEAQNWALTGAVESGSASEGKGFYYGLFRVQYPRP
jgi:hypothetical protein